MKNTSLTTIFGISVLLTGCAGTMPTLSKLDSPYIPPSTTFYTEDESYAYSKSIDCVMNLITTPMNGQFFTFNSEKLNKWVVKYKSGSIPFVLGSRYDSISNLRFSITKGTVDIKITDVSLRHVDLYGVPSSNTFPVRTEESKNKLDPILKNMVSSMENCIKQ